MRYAAHTDTVLIFVLIGIGRKIGTGIVITVINRLILAWTLNINHSAVVSVSVDFLFRLKGIGGTITLRVNPSGVWCHIALLYQLWSYRTESLIRIVIIR